MDAKEIVATVLAGKPLPDVFTSMTLEHLITTLEIIVKVSKKHDKKGMLNFILDHAENDRLMVDKLPLVTLLLVEATRLDREEIDFLLSTLPDKIPLDYYIDIVNMGEEESAVRCAEKLLKIFPVADWCYLANACTDEMENINEALLNFFKMQNSGRPAWMISTGEEEKGEEEGEEEKRERTAYS